MKAILINDDKSLRWDNVADPICGAEDCIVKIEAAGVNRADLLQREGGYPPPPGCPDWMGLEIAGTITQVGEEAAKKSPWKVGDKVCALLGGGGYAQYANIKYDMLMPIPEGCSVTHAAGLPEAFATAYLNLFHEGGAKAGDTLLITGGNSGLASVTIRMAKAFGLRVITTVRSKEKAEAIRDLGADIIVNTAEESLIDVLQAELAAGGGVDVAIDCLGGENMGKYIHYLKHGARWIMIAALAGTDTHIDLKNIYVRNVRIIGSTLRSRTPEFKAALLAELTEKVWPLVTAGKIVPTIYKALPITQAEAAQELLYKSQSVGKVILTVE
ncbi:MAG: NAD(P)H-quinone oxidoreductase [Oscillospiraceae bacterium]|nr:NAD(P)H-quinone oxidoreductase [Oscillospiraceae bacterium]